MLVSLAVWLRIFFSAQEGPKASQMAERVATVVSITRSALIYSPPSVRPALMLDLATRDSLRVQPASATDTMDPLPNNRYWQQVAGEVLDRLGPNTKISWRVNDTPGFWVSFEIENDQYWLIFSRSRLELTSNMEWAGWAMSAILLALIGAAISVGFVNRPLARLANVTRQLALGENPPPLPERGPSEIKNMNIAFNRMVKDLQQAESDREIMLAGISHDLRTPLARMRLEIELSDINDAAREAIDEDLAQIDYSIGQLMEYARPAGKVPSQGTNISEALHTLAEREQQLLADSDTTKLTTDIAPNLYAAIDAHDLKRILINLIENAKRYGQHPGNNQVTIRLSAQAEGNRVAIRVADKGAGLNDDDIQRLLRPFSRGQAARTGVSGTGLGLAIVERLLTPAGGHLQLSNRYPHGLTATVYLPRLRSRNVLTLEDATVT